ncbi:MBL fold metallo-hydrolase [Cobetia sp. L2A1]|uniref:MBL fold metallo-hydrolase n=1 Tax=Cobetia sp. L2A1 TaxID=2686360 RepID=UPI00131C48B5|nr:MBL fold metallo-hydrolase [Cobetia sp. L2A1]
MNKVFQKISLSLVISIFAGISAPTWASSTQCSSKDFSLQMLGSGGPISDDMRASSGELVWWKGKPRVLIDAGGGTFLRFGQSGAHLEDVDFIGISHFHTDHSADLAAILKNGVFFKNMKEITISGPQGNHYFPSLTQFMQRIFGADEGAYRYLAGIFSGNDGINLKVDMEDVDYKSTQPTIVYEKDGLKITAMGIPHGDVPNLAYRIETSAGTIVISADQNGTNPYFIDFAKGADTLVLPAAITEGADSHSKFIHGSPTEMGKLAAAIQPKVVILNHFMGKSLREQDQVIKDFKKYYSGVVYASRDLSCFPITVKKGE